MSITPRKEPEFSRVIVPSELDDAELSLEIEADAEECAALAERFGLEGISFLTAALRVKRVRGGRLLRLTGRLRAEVIQSCVITLEPVTNAIDAEISLLFGPEEASKPGRDTTPEEEEDVEPLTGDSLDLGEAVAEELALAIDPYPRKPGAVLEFGPSEPESGGSREGAAGATETRSHPFEGLAALRGNK